MKPAGVLFLVAILAGLVASSPVERPPATMGEYRVFAGDFHIHMFPLDAATLSPWDAVIEARRRGLDVISLNGHNQAWTSKVGRWFARFTGGPLVLVGEEIITPPYDMIAVGLRQTVDWRGTAAQTIAEIHRQGGIAIAAHPLRGYWPAYDQAAMDGLDGAEVLHPMAFAGEHFYAELREFYARKPMAAIGSSDFHGTAYPGFSRTYVFARELSEDAILDALRTHRTVTVDRDGRSHGDAALIRLAGENGGLPRSGVPPQPDAWTILSRFTAIAAMLTALFFGFRTPSPTA